MNTVPRARDIGIPFSGEPGPLNAITDVLGVTVGYSTLWSGEGKLIVGQGPVRTGVTAILPRGAANHTPCFAGWFALNGAGEMTGLQWIQERGLCEGPVLITNTNSIGVVRDATIQWMRRRGWSFEWALPVVGETYDGVFNDIDGCHVRPEHVEAALESARGGAISEGNVGGGTGMMTYEYKGGTGTASRQVSHGSGDYTVGVLVQSNYGERRQLRIAGVPIGEQLSDDMPTFAQPDLLSEHHRNRYRRWCGEWGNSVKAGDGSIIAVVATDAPLLPHQLNRVAKRPALAIGRLGGVGAANSGDIFLALSTGNHELVEAGSERELVQRVATFPNPDLTPIFEAVIDATEEAILNALVAAEAAEGANRFRISKLPVDRVRRVLEHHKLLKK